MCDRSPFDQYKPPTTVDMNCKTIYDTIKVKNIHLIVVGLPTWSLVYVEGHLSPMRSSFLLLSRESCKKTEQKAKGQKVGKVGIKVGIKVGKVGNVNILQRVITAVS